MNKNDKKRHLRNAGRILFERGWCQHMLESYDGKVCAMGALSVSMNGEAISFFGKDVNDVLRHPSDRASIVDFNNSDAENEHEVASLLFGLAEEI